MVKKYEDKGIILADKQQGETMGELTKRIRKEYKLTLDEKITFAGRLDPMASGLVIFLVGEKRFEREYFQQLSKVYDFDLILGVKTDTADILGLITEIHDKVPNVTNSDITSALLNLVGKREEAYPSYSSKHVGGRPLFEYARSGEEIPEVKREIEVFSLELKATKLLKREVIIIDILGQIKRVSGDFRQKEIIQKWLEARDFLPKIATKISCTAEVSSGTYIRTLAVRIGEKLGTTATAFNIQRNKVGLFTK